MRKVIALALVLILMLSLAACSAKENVQDSVKEAISDTPNGGEEAEPMPAEEEKRAPEAAVNSVDGQAINSLIQWMMDGKFSYDFTMTTEGNGEKTESTGSMAVDGKKMTVTTEMTVEGQTVKSRIIMKDDVTYIIDDVNKFIMQATGGINPTEGMMTDYSGIVKTGGGAGEIDGKTLPYEEYAEGTTGAAVRYYLDGNQVYGIETSADGYRSVMIIKNPSNGVPAGAFDLPDGYTNMGDIGAAASGIAPEDYLPDDFEMPDGLELPDGIKMP